MEKKKGLSLLKIFIAIVCILFILASLAVNIAFSGGKTPHMFGRYIYIVNDSDDIGSVSKGSALLAKEVKNDAILKRDIVICYPSSSPDKLAVRSINDVITAEDGVEKYSTASSKAVDPENITKDKIVAVATGYPESKELGKFITFSKSIPGILLELILPCVILVLFLIGKIVSSKIDDFDDEDFDFYEYEGENGADREAKRSHVKTGGTPLFEANQELPPSDELERKKMSIAEHFSQKKVNPDSPYQKEKERTMQFKAQRSAESSFAARNVGGSSSTAPTADALREEMLRKTAEAERTGNINVKGAAAKPADSASDITGVLSKAKLAEMSRSDVPKTTPLRSQSAQPAAKKSDSPDISDILKKSEKKAEPKPAASSAVPKKKSAADMSVDDLIAMIEKEKKKL